MHLSSLPNPYGIGTMGQCAREFIDFLKKAGQKYWQILPVCPTGFGDSPYQSFSTFAGNPYFIDLDELRYEGLLDFSDYSEIDWEAEADRVNFGTMYQKRYPVLHTAVSKFDKNNGDYICFCEKNKAWLDDYALYMAIKDANDGRAWYEWDEPLKKRNPQSLEEVANRYSESIDFWKIVQFLFFKQWDSIHKYANDNGVSIIGDLPIYVALDSADVWSNPGLFQLDEELRPVGVAGCPPDGFSATGQLWGNPLYRWDVMKDNGYEWWIKRIKFACDIYDVLRLDHFRGFESYYSIPYGDTDAKRGHWEKGPGIELFRSIEASIGKRRIIAEDLGFLTEPVKEMLAQSGYPGMKVFELGFDSRDSNSSEYLPHNCKKNAVAYVGTHDNDTIQGWFCSASKDDVRYACDYIGIKDLTQGHWEMMRALWATVADITIVQAQDLMGLGSESRMNTPSTTGCNWSWRALPGNFNDELADKIRGYMETYGR